MANRSNIPIIKQSQLSNMNDTQTTIKPKNTSISTFFKAILGFLIICLVICSGLFVYVLANPRSDLSRIVVEKSFLNDLIDLPGKTTENSTSSSSSQSSEGKILNNILGDQQQPTTSGLQFAAQADSKTIAEVVKDVLPSVISISVQAKSDGVKLTSSTVAGTGFLATSDGLMFTNRHVISLICKYPKDQIQITGVSSFQKAYELELLSVDPVDDIAILRVLNMDTQIQPVKLFNSDQLALGQDVVAIGNALGELQNSVTKGVVSGLDRSFQTQIKDDCTNTKFVANGLIQTDAAINPGNSGGPLFNASGQLIGMNTLTTADAQSISLSIPTQTLKSVLESFIVNNKIVRPRLGAETVQINALSRAQNKWIPTEHGEIVYSDNPALAISSGSPAATAGLKFGDIILEVNGTKLISNINNPFPLRREILTRKTGDKVVLKVLKAIKQSDAGFDYEKEPVEINATLGSVSFDIVTKQPVFL
jgi:serine protease Do